MRDQPAQPQRAGKGHTKDHMSLKTCMKLMSFATLAALIYIHMQTQIVELAYKGKDKEKRIHELMDNQGMLTHQILTLKSSNHLGHELLE